MQMNLNSLFRSFRRLNFAHRNDEERNPRSLSLLLRKNHRRKENHRRLSVCHIAGLKMKHEMTINKTIFNTNGVISVFTGWILLFLRFWNTVELCCYSKGNIVIFNWHFSSESHILAVLITSFQIYDLLDS